MSRRNRHRTAVLAASTALALALTGAAATQVSAAPAPTSAAAAPGLDAPVGPSRNTSFVTREGGTLRLDGEPFRFSGPNIYWLGLDENVGGVAYPTRFRIRDALDTAAATGATVVRSHMLASTGDPLTLRPEAGTWNDEAFATIDYAMAYAGELGIRLVLPLTDEWEYYHGGHRDFTDPLGLPGEAFYSDPRAVSAFDEYVTRVLTHVNPYTGLAYAEDPTVLAFELGNELRGMTPGWIEGRAALLRDLAPRHLVAAGTRFGIDPDTLASSVDVVDVHYYPPTAQAVLRDAAEVTASGKVYVAGEYASTAISDELLDPLVDEPTVSGMLFWSLFPHGDRSGFVPHDDGFTLHVPGDDARMRLRVDTLEDFSRELQDGRAPAPEPLEPPLVTEVLRRAGVPQVTWRGTAGAAAYHVERAAGPRSGWVRLTDRAVPASDEPWLDLTEQRADAASTLYRVVPVGRDGVEGPASDPVRAGGGDAVLVDPLEDWGLTSSHSDGLATSPAGDESAVVARAGDGQVTWERPGTTGLELLVAARGRPTGPSGTLRVEVPDGDGTWVPVDTSLTRDGRDRWWVRTGELPEVGRVRVVWGEVHGRGPAARPVSLVRAVVRTRAEVVAGAPGAFAQVAPADGAAEVGTSPALRWEEARDAAYYRVVLEPVDGDGGPPVTATGLPGTSWTPPAGLEPGTTYRWSVTAVNGAGSTVATGGGAGFTTRSLPTAPVVVEDFSGLDDDAAARAAVTVNPGGDPVVVSLARGGRRDPAAADDRALALQVQPGSAGYAGVSRDLPEPQDWWGQRGLQLWVDPEDASPVTVQLVAGGGYWEAVVTPDGTGPQVLQVPFTDLAPPSWASGGGELELGSVTQVSFYLAGTSTPRTTVVDSVTTYL
ncbi:carbohydrate binding domain-containing protein [Pseudokineococcus basanitobsidens]|uniref:mannan endo-1,4-beta-mannosidase n=1 Tax=Pseudokineococcus basanitobsidens TaxID=1926649 RepID=A0ABU8RLK6_9ACTN